MLMGKDRVLTEAGAQAIAAYGGQADAMRILINFASSRQMREQDRLIVIRAIGGSSQKQGAEFLLSLLLREDDSQQIRQSAAEALADMTGHIENGSDPVRWQQWWEQNTSKTEAQWQEEMRAYRASRYSQLRLQYEQLTGELQTILTQTYELTPEAQQPALMLTYLRSSNPEFRRVGAIIVHDEAMAAHAIPQEAREQIRTMVSDSSREVRLAVAGALLATSDPAALDSLLRQLERERDPAVRAALAAPLAATGDLRAVPALQNLLDDASVSTAWAGATALRELGPLIYQRDRQMAKTVAQHLQKVLSRMQSGPGAVALQEAVAEALIPLRDPEVLPAFHEMLRGRASTRMRWAAIRGMGELRDPKSADTIARYLEDRESGVRLEAVRSLGKTSPVEFAEELYRRTNPVEETDSAVRDEAWAVLQSSFARMPLEQLPSWLQRYANDPARRAVVLQAMLSRADAQADLSRAASTRQLMGNCLMELNQPSDAAAQYKASLGYFSGQPGSDMIVEQLTEQYLLSLLRGRNYREAAAFSSVLLAKRTSYQQTVGVQMRNEMRLLLGQERPVDAALLMDAVKTIQPPLAPQYAEELAALGAKAAQLQSPTTATQPAMP